MLPIGGSRLEPPVPGLEPRERGAGEAAFMQAVKAAIARGIASSPLTDMPAHTRHLEAAYRSAIAGAAPPDA